MAIWRASQSGFLSEWSELEPQFSSQRGQVKPARTLIENPLIPGGQVTGQTVGRLPPDATSGETFQKCTARSADLAANAAIVRIIRHR